MEDGVGSNNTASAGSASGEVGDGALGNPADVTADAVSAGLGNPGMGMLGGGVTAAVDALSTGGAVMGAGLDAAGRGLGVLADALAQATVDVGTVGIYGATSEPATPAAVGFGNGDSDSFAGSWVGDSGYTYQQQVPPDTSWDRG